MVKRTWNTMDYTNSDYRAYWNDVQTSEQHFGLAEYISTDVTLYLFWMENWMNGAKKI